MQTLPPNSENQTSGVRSSSAMGSIDRDTSTGGGTKSGSESRDWFWAGLTRNASHGSRHNNYGLQPLNEDGPPPSTFESPERQQSPPIANSSPEPITSSKEQPMVPQPERGNPSTDGLTRTRSTNQMRDIRDQMQDLKGKISSLKQRAREDSLRRRSLQSLRTPSPFTAAEQWYTGAQGYNRDRSKSRPREGSPPTIQPAIEEEDETKQYPVQDPALEIERNLEPTTGGSSRDSEGSQVRVSSANGSIMRESDDSPRTVIDGPSTGANEVADQALLAESQIPNQEIYEEARKDQGTDDVEEDMDEISSAPIGGRHEDRPDAFDYEHLFLHSGMGTIGREGRSRSSSHSSTYSVETTKPSNVTTEPSEVSSDGNASLDDAKADEGSSELQRVAHERKGSVESVSTVATFATATEGKSSDEDEEEWVYSRPMAGSWEPEYPNHRKVAVGRKEASQQITQGTKPTLQNRNQPTPVSNGTEIAGSHRELPAENKILEDSMPSLLAFLTGKLLSKGGVPSRSIELNDSDKELAERLVRSVAQVCSQLQAFSMEGNKYGGRPWRRRLDGARRVLDGETNGEVF